MNFRAFGLIALLGSIACSPVSDTRPDHVIEDQEVFSKDSIKFFNYIIEVDSLQNLKEVSPDDSARIVLLKKEIKYYRNKWGGKLR